MSLSDRLHSALEDHARAATYAALKGQIGDVECDEHNGAESAPIQPASKRTNTDELVKTALSEYTTQGKASNYLVCSLCRCVLKHVSEHLDVAGKPSRRFHCVKSFGEISSIDQKSQVCPDMQRRAVWCLMGPSAHRMWALHICVRWQINPIYPILCCHFFLQDA